MQEISILYSGLTICLFVALKVAGMGFFDSCAFGNCFLYGRFQYEGIVSIFFSIGAH